MSLRHTFSIFILVFILPMFLLPTPTHAATCTDTYLSGSSVPTGYGASYNVFSTAKELLVKTTSCTDTSLSIKAGNDDANTLVYKEGYHWSGTAWIKYDLTSPDPLQFTYYYPKAATASVPIPTGNTSKYYVAYTCLNISNAWKCGCSNTTCATRAWQLQKVNKTGDSTSGPVCGNNICEAGETKTSCSSDCDDGGGIPTGTLRLLSLGDSITKTKCPNGYRFRLWEKLKAAGFKIDNIGTQPDPSSCAGFDGEHEGHSGWTSTHILYGNKNEPGTGTLSVWLNGYTPDLVLIHLGTNDVGGLNIPAATTIANLTEIIRLIRNKNSNVKIILAQIVPRPEKQAAVDALNKRIGPLATQLNTSQSPVIAADLNTGFPMNSLPDGIHPNPTGSRWMADRWYDAIRTLY